MSKDAKEILDWGPVAMGVARNDDRVSGADGHTHSQLMFAEMLITADIHSGVLQMDGSADVDLRTRKTVSYLRIRICISTLRAGIAQWLARFMELPAHSWWASANER